ncbi:hypothetical protein FO519_000520 [Halicephalobus sp. NKZ332]|nr:hypothetical protein FO519_000520 [Halicephalobus sp. NKZ332]
MTSNPPTCPLIDSQPLEFASLPIEFRERFAQRLAPRDAIKNFARTSKFNGLLCAKYHIATLLEQESKSQPMPVYPQPVLQRPLLPPWHFPRGGPGSDGANIPGAPRPWMIYPPSNVKVFITANSESNKPNISWEMCFTSDNHPYNYIDSTIVVNGDNWIIGAISIFFTVIGLFAALVVVFLVLKSNYMQCSFGYFNFCHAVGSIANILSFTLFTGILAFINPSYCSSPGFGWWAGAVHSLSTSLQFFTYTLIGFNRLFAVFYPLYFDNVFSQRHGINLCIISWSTAMVLNLPYFLIPSFQLNFNISRYQFQFTNPDPPAFVRDYDYILFTAMNIFVRITVAAIDLNCMAKLRKLAKECADSGASHCAVKKNFRRDMMFVLQSCANTCIHIPLLIFSLTGNTLPDNRLESYFKFSFPDQFGMTIDIIIIALFSMVAAKIRVLPQKKKPSIPISASSESEKFIDRVWRRLSLK